MEHNIISTYTMKRVSLIFVAMCVAGLVTSCDRSRSGHRIVQAVGKQELVAYVAGLQQKKPWPSSSNNLAKEMWHPAFLGQGVQEVRLYSVGVQIVTEIRKKSEAGLYVVTNQAEIPEEGSGIYFKRIADGIYWFEEKVREEVVP